MNNKYSFDKLIFATGHSAKTIYKLFKEKEIAMEPKPFALGVRVEHLQKNINRAMYHGDYPNLPSASYKLVTHLDNNRSVFSFCMCPGGVVVNATSEEGLMVTNGMSYNSRDLQNANSAILVNVRVDDYYHGDIEDGIKFQEELERKCYQASNSNKVLVQTYGDFKKHQTSTKLLGVSPSVKPGYVFYNLWDVLPNFVCESINLAMDDFDKKIKGFNDPSTILSAVESRSSSTITVKRSETYESSMKNIYMIGEGSGASGGITTSAIDGIKVALKIISSGE